MTTFFHTIFLISALLGFVKGLGSPGDCERQTLDTELVNVTHDDISLLHYQTTVAANVWFE